MENTTPIVKLLADGGIECAKGLELKDCGYKPGAKVCGKCGAKAVTQSEQAVPSDMAPEASAPVKGEKSEWVTASEEKTMHGDSNMPMASSKKKKKPMMAVVDEEEKGMHGDDEMSMDPAKKKRMMDFMEQEKMYDEEEKGMHGDGEMSTDALMKKKKRMMAFLEEEKMYGEDEDEDDEMDDDLDADEEKMYGEIEKMMEQRKKARAKRMDTMGVKSADYDDLAFVCAIERKVYAGGSQICASCPGGCEQQDTMPSLLEVEGMAETMFAGKVLDSGYADEVDIFVVDVQRKDGKPVEAYFDGTSGECMGWHLLNEDLIGEVATIPGQKVISFSEASSIATKSIQGDVVSVDADMFDGYDAYAVEIEGIDGKSYDVYVGVDGEILGYDEYDADEASDIDEEIADIALKAMYGEDERMEMAKGGMAMADGSYPIKDEEDLKMAIMAVGRAKDQNEAKMHCMKRAKELDREDMIPESWSSEKYHHEKVLVDDEAKQFLSNLMELEMLQIETGFGEV